jgi:hypothetical protein
LRRKLLCFFSLGLFINVINLTVYTLTAALFTAYFIEMAVISGNCGALYLVLNLYFLDVLRDGVMGQSTSISPEVAEGPGNQVREHPGHPERKKDIELVIRSVRVSR